MNLLIKIATQLYIFTAVSPIVIIFLIKKESYFCAFSLFVFAFVYSNLFLNCCLKKFGDESVECDFVEIAEPKFTPIYIAYFVVALSVNNDNILLFWIIFLGIFILIQGCKFSFFNPFVLLKFNFYEATTKNNTGANYRLFLISKRNIKNIDKISNLIRLNNFTFLQKDENE